MGGVIKNKAHHLLVPFAIYYIFTVAMKLLRAFLAGKFSMDLLSVFNENAVWFHIGPIWFLLALFYITILWNVLYRFNNVWVRYGLLILLLLIPFFFKGENPAYICSALLGLPFFAIGKDFKAYGCYEKLLCRYRDVSIYGQILIVLLLTCIVAVTAVDGNALSFNKISTNPFVYMLNGLLGSLLVLLLATVLDRNHALRRFFSAIGRCSLHIMAVHLSILVFVFNAIAMVGKHFTTINLFDSYLCNFVVFVIGSAISYFLGVFFQKYIFNPLKL